jgi:hypothetical protein
MVLVGLEKGGWISERTVPVTGVCLPHIKKCVLKSVKKATKIVRT